MRQLLSVLPAAVLAVTSLAAVAAIKLAPAAGQPVVAVFSPQMDTDEALRRVVAAGGSVLRHGGLPSLLIARSSEPDFVASLYKMGAVLVADANGARGCPEDGTGGSR